MSKESRKQQENILMQISNVPKDVIKRLPDEALDNAVKVQMNEVSNQLAEAANEF
ncbi:hypothetical protein ACQW5G_01320 [Fructilactobacillus sp. Tb1]|uniref:hypothetical protein n=1 Tax=Fructilactobacillus sp. Tb1 TaxID=3422304 RepID=UPI003D2708BB